MEEKTASFNMHEETMIFDEFSLADSKSVGTGYVIKDKNDGSVSILTDDQVSAASAASAANNPSRWNALNKLFARGGSPPPSTRKISKNNSSKHNSNRSNRDEFEDNVIPKYRTDVDFYFNSSYKHSSRRQNNRVMFRELSKKSASLHNINASTKRFDSDGGGNGDDDSPPSPAIDFLKDEKSEMTNGRRLALYLMKYKWYNPHAGAKDENSNSNNNNNSNNDLDATNVNVSAMFESNQAVASTKDGKKISGGLPTTPLGSVTIREEHPSLEQAWAYFEHVTLPRYVKVYKNESGGQTGGGDDDDKQKKSETFANSCGGGQIKEIAESGERYFRTKLYHPFLTPLNQLGGFGLGIALYFYTLRAVMILLFIAGLVSIPNFIYFSGPEYSNNQENVFWALRGSSVCTEYEFVPCLDCTLDGNFALAKDRLRLATNQLGETITFALKNNCNGATRATIMTNMAAILFLVIGIGLLSYNLWKQEDKLDESVQTARDYSIVILNPPSDAGDPVEWRDYFMKKFDNLHVTCCTVAVHNENLVKALVQRRELLQKIRKALPPDELSLDKNDLKIVVEDIREERGCTVCKGLPEYYDKLLKLEETIKELVVDDKAVASVFVTFEYESSQQRVVNALNQDARTDEEHRKYPFREGYEPLKVKRASEPSAVRWQDLSESRWHSIRSLFLPFIVTIALITASTFAVYFLREGFWIIPGDPMYASFAISAGNFLFPIIAKALTNLEVHRREGHKQTSLYVKNAIFRWINTVVVFSIITPNTSAITPGKDGLLYGVYSIFFSEIVVSTSLGFLDIGPNLQRHLFAPRAKTQEDMNNCMGGREIDLAERYTTLTKLLLLTVWYCALYPLVLFFGAFAILMHLITDKFCLMRSWAPSAQLGSTISKMNRKYFFTATSIIVVVISSYVWTGFSFDNLCAIDNEVKTNFTHEYEVLSLNENETITLTVNSETQFYRFCEQSLLEKGSFPASNPSFKNGLKWMTEQQERFTGIYGWVGVGAICIIGVIFAYTIGNNARYKNTKSLQKTKKIPFHASGVNVRAYIPQVNSDAIPFPLVACSVRKFDSKLFDWQSPYQSHEYYDLTLDAEDIMEEEEEIEIADMAFSKVRYWEQIVA